MRRDECALAYSGGTDSTCAAALLAGRFKRLHLLTFRERATSGAPAPVANVQKLRARFPDVEFVHRLISVDRLVEKIGYDRYLSYLRRHGFFVLATPGFSSLAWHVRMIAYCLDEGVVHAADGLTRELMHFPGHMDGVVALLGGLYARFGLEYSNPVRDWDVPRDQIFLDRLIVDRHGFALAREDDRGAKTTGRRLYELGLMPAPNVKGSALDRSMQHDCYPFVLFHLFAFWYYLAFHDVGSYQRRVGSLMRDKIEDAARWIDDYRQLGSASPLSALLER